MVSTGNQQQAGNWMIVILTALAPMIWGSTYLVTTEFLPPDIPFTAAMIRTIPAGLALIFWKRAVIERSHWGRMLLLAALNIGVFQALLFVAAYRLPGGVASILGSIQPLVILLLAWIIDQRLPGKRTLLAAIVGVGGMAMLFAGSADSWDLLGILAALAGTVSMSIGTYLSKRWQPGIPLLPFVGWQLLLGGLMLTPVALLFDQPLANLEGIHWAAFIYLSLLGALLGYVLWFQGIRKLPPAVVSSLGLLSPLTAVFLGWAILGQALDYTEMTGVVIVLLSVITIQIHYQNHEKQSETSA